MEGRIGPPLHLEHGAHQAALLSTTGLQSENISGESCEAAAESTNAALETYWGRGRGGVKKILLQEDDIHLHCCFVSKVRRQLGIRQLRRGSGSSCYWQEQMLEGKLALAPFFF